MSKPKGRTKADLVVELEQWRLDPSGEIRATLANMNCPSESIPKYTMVATPSHGNDNKNIAAL